MRANASANGQSGRPVKGSGARCVPLPPLSITRCDSGVSACFAGGGSVGGRNGADRVVVVDCVVVVLCGEESGAVAGVAEVAVSVGVASAPVVVVAMVVFVV
jgi:hypothetical protein